ncbi:hypothetical protein CYMTET_12248, partial [Cymbomonas tetramitiformis]
YIGDEEDHPALAQLCDAMADPSVHELVVTVDILLDADYPLPTVYRSLDIRGACDGGTDTACTVDGQFDAPFLELDGCADQDWRDDLNFTCNDYYESQFCSMDGGYGANWAYSWGLFEDYLTAGQPSPVETCCRCGGATTSTGEALELTLTNLNIINSWSAKYGAAVSAYGHVHLSLDSCYFERNEALVGGGSIAMQSSRDASLTMTNCEATDNSAQFGAVVYVSPVNAISYPRVEIAGGSMQFNTAAFGAAVFARVNATLVLRGVTASHNEAKWGGGAVCGNYNVSLTFEECELNDNTVNMDQYVYIDEGTIYDLPVRGGGAVLAGDTSSVLLSNSWVLRNIVDVQTLEFNEGGGGIAGGIRSCITVTRNSTVAHNQLHRSCCGGGLMVVGDGANVSVTGNSSVTNNYGNYGGGISTSQGNGVLIVIGGGSRVSFNQAVVGGGINGWNSAVTVLLTQASQLSSNKANEEGGGIYVHSYSKIQIEMESVVRNNFANKGGGLYGYQHNQIRLHNHSGIIQNEAVLDGGGILLGVNSYLSLEDSVLRENSAGLNGGGMSCEEGTKVQALRTELKGNKAEAGGAGVYLHTSPEGSFTVAVFEDCGMVENVAKRSSGGGVMANPRSDVTIQGNSLIQGNTGTSGGGVSLWKSSLRIMDGVTFQNNSGVYHGGAISMEESNMTLSNCSIQGNRANFSGGGIFSTLSELSVNAVSLLDNQATVSGGAIHLSDSSTADLGQVLIQTNTAREGGGIRGALYLVNANASLLQCNFSYNQAMTRDMQGGGAVVGAGASLEAERTQWEGNMAELGGGAVAMLGEAAALSLRNSSFMRCSAFVGGSVMLQWPSVLASIHFRELRLHNPQDALAQNIYWHVNDWSLVGSHAPTCEGNCTVLGDGVLFSTNGVRPSVTQEGLGAVTSVEAASGYSIQPPISYYVLDYYSNLAPIPVTQRSSVVPVVATLYGQLASYENWSVGGQILQTYRNPEGVYGAVYDNLVVTGDPGSQVDLFIMTGAAEWAWFLGSVRVNLTFCNQARPPLHPLQDNSNPPAPHQLHIQHIDELTLPHPLRPSNPPHAPDSDALHPRQPLACLRLMNIPARSVRKEAIRCIILRSVGRPYGTPDVGWTDKLSRE